MHTVGVALGRAILPHTLTIVLTAHAHAHTIKRCTFTTRRKSRSATAAGSTSQSLIAYHTTTELRSSSV